MQFTKHSADMWGAVGPGEIFDRESVNVCKLAPRGKWVVVCFDNDLKVTEKLYESSRVDAFAVAEAWLSLDPNTSARSNRAREIAYELPNNSLKNL